MRQCYGCGLEWVSENRRPGFKEYCERCSAYLHCCKNCRFYSARAHNNCTIPTTEWVPDKAGVCYCDDFEFGKNTHNPLSDNTLQDTKDSLNELFGGKLDDNGDEEPKDLDALFGD